MSVNKKTQKRSDYFGWDETFMLLSELISKRSKDPNSQVGACIVDSNKIIVGVGYNGFPRGVSDDTYPWSRDNKNALKNKYVYVVHAEANAILNSTQKLDNCVIYTNLFPCNECTKMIIQSGIKEVVYSSDKYADLETTIASKKMLKSAGVKTRKYVCTNKLIFAKTNEK